MVKNKVIHMVVVIFHMHTYLCINIFWFISKNVKMGFYGQSNMCMLQMELEILNLMNINN
jgi:hypothetical protein